MYALAAIPIWMLKMETKLGVIIWFLNELEDGLDWVMDKVSKMLSSDFSGMLSGNKGNGDSIINYDGASNSFKFFPSPGSPFFILWIVFLTMGLIIMLLLIIVGIVKKLAASDDEMEQQSGFASGIRSVVMAIVMVFFVPFVVFSSMTLGSTMSRALFHADSSPSDKNSVGEYNGTIKTKLTEATSSIYDIGTKNPLLIQDGEDKALYSHTGVSGLSGVTDLDESKLFGNSQNLYPFHKTTEVFERLNYELGFLGRNNTLLFDQPTQYAITSLQGSLKEFLNKYISGTKTVSSFGLTDTTIEEALSELKDIAGQVREGYQNQAKLARVSFLGTIVSGFRDSTVKIFEDLRNLISFGDSIITPLKNGEDVQNELMIKYNSLYLATNPTKHIHLLSKKTVVATTGVPAFTQSKATGIDSMNKLAAYLNIFSLTKTYIAPTGMNSKKSWSAPFSFGKSAKITYSSDSTFMDMTKNVHKMVGGYSIADSGHNISLKMMGYTFSSYQKTILSDVAHAIAHVGTNPMQNLVAYPLSLLFIFLSFMVIYQIVKRVIERFAKLVFLWIGGMISIPSSIRWGSQAPKLWFGQVMKEVTVLVGIGLGLEVWTQLTPLLMKWISGFQNGDAGVNLGKILFEGMTALSLLSLVVKFVDWLSELLGSSGNMSALNPDMAGGAKQMSSKLKGQKTSGSQIKNKVGSMKEGGGALKGGLGKFKAKFGKGK